MTSDPQPKPDDVDPLAEIGVTPTSAPEDEAAHIEEEGDPPGGNFA